MVGGPLTGQLAEGCPWPGHTAGVAVGIGGLAGGGWVVVVMVVVVVSTCGGYGCGGYGAMVLVEVGNGMVVAGDG